MTKKTVKTFLIISHILHYRHENKIFSYEPYVREMNLWLKHSDSLLVVAPLRDAIKPDPIQAPYEIGPIKFFKTQTFDFTTLANIPKAILFIPGIILKIYKAMTLADHIHIRCPGNMGLLALLVQVLFPRKPKTVKYAGNWGRYRAEPISYKFQKFLASSPMWCKNTKVLVYSDQPGRSKNVIPFFTATYRESEKNLPASPRYLSAACPVRLLFVGTLSPNKRPMIPIEACKALEELGIEARLDIFGVGPMKNSMSERVRELNLQTRVNIHGNVGGDTLAKYYRDAHFLLLLSFSEGWPKVVAEAMFWGCVPIVSDVSYVSFMLGGGDRGLAVAPKIDAVIDAIKKYINDPSAYYAAAKRAMEWSRQYTLEKFEEKIQEVMEHTWS